MATAGIRGLTVDPVNFSVICPYVKDGTVSLTLFKVNTRPCRGLCDAMYTWRGQCVDDSVLNCDWLKNIINNVLQKQ